MSPSSAIRAPLLGRVYSRMRSRLGVECSSLTLVRFAKRPNDKNWLIVGQ